MKLTEIFKNCLNIPCVDELFSFLTEQQKALGEKEQINILEIQATKTNLIIRDNLTKITKTYSYINERYNITKEKLNQDFKLNLEQEDFDKIMKTIYQLIEKYPQKVKSISELENDLKVEIFKNEKGIHKIKNIYIIEPKEVEKEQ